MRTTHSTCRHRTRVTGTRAEKLTRQTFTDFPCAGRDRTAARFVLTLWVLSRSSSVSKDAPSGGGPLHLHPLLFFHCFPLFNQPQPWRWSGTIVDNGDSACGSRLHGFQAFVLVYFHLVVAFQRRFFVGYPTDDVRSVGTGQMKKKRSIGITLQFNKVVNNGTTNWKIFEDMSVELNINQTVRVGLKLTALSINFSL